MTLVVLLVAGRAELLLERVKRHDDGSIKSGYVINGGWNFERRDGEVLAKAGNHIVTRRPDPGYTEFPIPPRWSGDYNDLMTRAEVEASSRPSRA